MSSLLEGLRSRNKAAPDLHLDAYQKALRECPPVSAALLAYLDNMFARKPIPPTSPSLQQELVFQAGIDKVLMHLRSRNEQQERNIRETRTKED